MNGTSVLGIGLLAGGVFLATAVVLVSALPLQVKRLVLSGGALRIVGGLVYLGLIGSYYGGGDYLLYYREGLEYAERIWAGDWSAAWGPELRREQWWGTPFTSFLSGLTLTVIGPTLAGAFVVFALAGYAGVLAIARAFHNAFPELPVQRYLAWVAFFPSLWFWPAALGKDALILCGIGLATLGFSGPRGRVRWPLLALGIALVFVIRPQVAAVLGFSILAGQWLGGRRGLSLGRVLQGVLIAALGLGVLFMASGALGVSLFSPDEVDAYLTSRAETTSRQEGSSIEAASGLLGPLVGLITVLFRPFPWEARGVTALLASLEVMVFWGLVAWHRASVRAFIRAHWRSPLFWMAAIFVLTYGATLGLAIGNLGIIARQRVHVFPFLFMLLGAEATSRAMAPRPLPVPRRLAGART